LDRCRPWGLAPKGGVEPGRRSGIADRSRRKPQPGDNPAAISTVSEVESPLDRLNRPAWARPQVVERFAHLERWSQDAGAAVLIQRVAEDCRNQPILDVGIGGGRTVPLLRAISDDYVGIDYTQEMVDAASARFPGVRCEWGDARDLSKFADGSFALVFFS